MVTDQVRIKLCFRHTHTQLSYIQFHSNSIELSVSLINMASPVEAYELLDFIDPATTSSYRREAA